MGLKELKVKQSSKVTSKVNQSSRAKRLRKRKASAEETYEDKKKRENQIIQRIMKEMAAARNGGNNELIKNGEITPLTRDKLSKRNRFIGKELFIAMMSPEEGKNRKGTGNIGNAVIEVAGKGDLIINSDNSDDNKLKENTETTLLTKVAEKDDLNNDNNNNNNNSDGGEAVDDDSYDVSAPLERPNLFGMFDYETDSDDDDDDEISMKNFPTMAKRKSKKTKRKKSKNILAGGGFPTMAILKNKKNKRKKFKNILAGGGDKKKIVPTNVIKKKVQNSKRNNEKQKGDANNNKTGKESDTSASSVLPPKVDKKVQLIHIKAAIQTLEERVKQRKEGGGKISKTTEEMHKQLMAKRLRRERNQIALKAAMYAKGNSKAIASQYVRKQDVADNKHKRAIVHHTSSHYHMLHGRNFQSGNRIKGVTSRHSRQNSIRQMKSRSKMLKARDVARGITGPSGKGGGKTKSKKKKSKKGKK